MSVFVYKEKTFAFDVTNADDMLRLQEACRAMEAAEQTILQHPAEENACIAQLRACYTMYRSFFMTVFPERGKDIVGPAPSAMEGIKAFRAFLRFLEECRAEEAALEKELCDCYGLQPYLAPERAQ